MIPNITLAMKHHLRGSILVGEMDFFDEATKKRIIKSSHRPNIINKLMMKRVMDLNKRGLLSVDKLFILDKEIKGFTDIIGACERIKSTPIPYSYSMFIKKFLFIYCITLPMTFIWGIWILVDHIGGSLILLFDECRVDIRRN